MENKDKKPFVFDRSNYKLLLIGIGLNVIGFLLMIGGAAPTLDEFNADELFSHRRITLSTIVIVLGYVVILYSIMKKPNRE